MNLLTNCMPSRTSMCFSMASLAAGQKIPSLTGICVSSLDWILRWPSMSTTMKSWTSLTSSLSTSSTVSMANTVQVSPSCQLHVKHCTHTVEGAALSCFQHLSPSAYQRVDQNERKGNAYACRPSQWEPTKATAQFPQWSNTIGWEDTQQS